MGTLGTLGTEIKKTLILLDFSRTHPINTNGHNEYKKGVNSVSQRVYPPFPPDIATAWPYFELMLRGAQDVGDDVEIYFERLCKQTAYISQLSHGDPLICTLLEAAYDFFRDQHREGNAA